jgi:hypothetical protein
MQGQAVSATTGEWVGTQPLEFTYQWQRCTAVEATACANIPGENEPQHLAVPADVGQRLRVVVVASNSDGTGTRSSAITGVVSDTVPPVISSLTLSPKAFHAARFGPSISAVARGATVTYQLSEPAQVTYRIERAARGVKRAGRCVKRTRSTPAKAKACTRYFALKPLLGEEATEGENSFRLNGRLGGAPLKPGGYRLGAEASDGAGNRTAAPMWAGLTIVAERRPRSSG